ncbi:hypothetical protein [Halomonas elongata]|uniref:Adhesin n=1 Tax=Halomonas elongata (strain ATCC 33173 / DSM 2581 / NBRC 15536 / NCIMB 2198 / 1H9) TaxID=768066 RepID=E1V7R8_HALED|nr:hypothetical protein [Halomonas elongata]WBF17251.1 hypothetical protein LM502_14365 [Halomonas elongata]WPU46087.1 hypothetical protein SR933_12595 [Halomonas elongata DSM 2581]CBV43506.1 uncharacterized protein HELO_3622 [Halomonas elongata DSM 2581]
MKTFQKAPLALAVAALMAAPAAFAWNSGNDFDTDSEIDSKFDNNIDVELNHDSDTYKDFKVDVRVRTSDPNYAGATVDSKQLINGNGVDNTVSTNNADLDGNALRNAAGNIGVNVAAGDNNQQANDAALAASDAARVFGQAAAFSAQSSSNNVTINSGSPNNARMGGNALLGASGNIGVNVAAGVGNGQQNSLAAAVNTSSGSADATTGGVQTTYGNHTANSGHTETFTNTTDVTVSGVMVGGYAGVGRGRESGTYNGTYTGQSDQIGDVYLDTWSGATHTGGTSTGHIDVDSDAQFAQDLNGDGGAFAFNEDGTTEGQYRGRLGFREAGLMAMGGTLSGSVTATNTVYVANENNAELGGNALRGAVGNIGVNVAAGTNNLQRNSLSIASSAAGGGAGGGSE